MERIPPPFFFGPYPFRHVYSEQTIDEPEQSCSQEAEEGGAGETGAVTPVTLAARDSVDVSAILLFALSGTSTLNLGPDVISASLLFL